jgi:uncharacterized protein involved in exopolysaccharide biosynthesis
MPKKYEANSKVFIERDYLNDMMKGIAAAPSINDRVQAISTIMKSRPLVLAVIKELDHSFMQMPKAELELIVKDFQNKTEIKVETSQTGRRDMEVFTVSLKYRDPVFARDYVNTLVRRYIEEILSSSRDETSGASKFLKEQLDLFKEKIDTIDANIAKLKQESGVVAEDRLVALQKKLNDLLVQYTDQHPEVVKVKDEIESLRGQKGRNHREGTGRDVADDQQVVKAAAQKGTQKIAGLERERDAYRKIYEEMMAAQGRSEVSSHIEVKDKGGTFKILEPAILPLKPIGMDRVKLILLGIIAGIGVGIGSIILLDSMDKSVKSVDAMNAFGLPILAVIPHIQIPAEVKKTRIKDLALYTFTGIYYIGIAAVLVHEFLGKEIK